MPRSVFVHRTAVVDRDAEIGAGSKIWHFTHIASGAHLGMHCFVGQNVYVAPRARVGDGVTLSNNVSLYDGVVLEDRVFVGPSAVFTNVEVPRADPGRRPRTAEIRVGEGATIGANATLLAGVHIGPWAFVGAGAVVTHDVPAHALEFGVPARKVGWVCECGRRLNEALRCEGCDLTYLQHGQGLVKASEGRLARE